MAGATGRWELEKAMAIVALERSLAAAQQPATSSSEAADAAGHAHIPGRHVLLGLQAPTKLYPASASSEAASPGTPSAGPTTQPVHQASLKWSKTLIHRSAAGNSSISRNKYTNSSSSAAEVTQPHAQRLALPQRVHAAATWQAAPSSTAAGPTLGCTTKSSGTAGASSKHTSLLLLHQQGRDRNMAVLLMERRLTQLSQALAEAQQLQAQLMDADAAHKQHLGKAQAAGQAQLEALQLHVAKHLEQRRQRQLLGRCTAAWRWRSCQQQAAQQLLYQVQLRQLQVCCGAWAFLSQQCKAQVDEQAAPEQAALLQQRQQLEQALAAWQAQAVQQQQWHEQQLARAERWHHRRVLCGALSTWRCMYRVVLIDTEVARTCCHRLLLRKAFQAWTQGLSAHTGMVVGAIMKVLYPCKQPGAAWGPMEIEQDQLLSCSNSSSGITAGAAGEDLQRQVLNAWRGLMFLQVQQRHLQGLHQQHVLRHSLRLWVQHGPTMQAQHAAASTAFAAVGAKLLKQWGVQAFLEHRLERQACQHLQQQKLWLLLGSWKRLAAAAARRQRLVAGSRQRQLRQCFAHWWQQAVAASRQAAADQANELKGVIVAQQSSLDCAQAREAAAAEQLKLEALHNQQLQQQAVDACRGALTEMQFVPALAWRSLPFSPGEAALQPRARHAAFRLDVLQPPQQQQQACTVAADTGAAGGSGSPGTVSSGCLLVFGGVCGSSWLADVTLLVLEEEATGGMKISIVLVPVQHNAADGADGADTALSSGAGRAASQLMMPVRDFAACACGQNQFVVSGGFGTDLGAFHLQLCELMRQQPTAAEATHAACTPSSPCSSSGGSIGSESSGGGGGGSSSSSNSWYNGWAARWTLLQPRSQAPGPPGRCHHSISCYGAGRSLVVFGGWADRQGCLADLWLFHMDHMEWWHPEVEGSRPAHRRSHAAALVGHKLYIHGGLDSSGNHLADMWCVDLQAWQWTQQCCVAQSGESACCPSARRAHTLEVVGGRYLLLHGGYDGTSLLGDTWVFDTHSSRWLLVDVQAPASEMPAPRALHTLTSLGQRFVLLGGKGPLGELAAVSLLECPAVQQGMLLQHQQQCSQAQLLHCQQRCTQLTADLVHSRAELQEARRQLQAAVEQASQLTAQATAGSKGCCALECQLQEARAAAAAAQLDAQQAARQAEALGRRLTRARQGGNKAVEAAACLSQQLQTAEAGGRSLQQQLHQVQQQLQQQQVVLSERAAEVAMLRGELAGCQAHASLVAGSAQADFKVALARSNKLYSQELRHLQRLLQAAHKSQKQLAQQVAQLQAQPPQAPQQAPAPEAAASAADNSLLEHQQEQQSEQQSEQQQQQQQDEEAVAGSCQKGGAAPTFLQHTRCCCKCSGSKCVCGSDYGGCAVDNAWHAAAAAAAAAADIGAGPGQLLCMSAGQLALVSTRQGRAQAQLELAQQQLQKQQDEMAALKQQLRVERQAAAAAQEQRATAVEQLHLAEQRHQQQLQQLEENVKGYKWKLWEVEADAARRGASELQCKDAWKLAAACPAAVEQVERFAGSGVVAGQLVDAAGDDDGDGALRWAGVDRRFCVKLVARPGPGDQLEMLPEVVRLFELHRSTMSRNLV